MADILGLRVIAPWAHEGSLGTITVSGGVTPSLVYYVTRLSKLEMRRAEEVAAYLEADCQKTYPASSITIERGLFYQAFSWVAMSGEFVEEIVRDIVELAEIEASGMVPFWIKPLIHLETRLHRSLIDTDTPILRDAPVDGAYLMLELYRNAAWYVANGIFPELEQ